MEGKESVRQGSKGVMLARRNGEPRNEWWEEASRAQCILLVHVALVE